MKERMSVSVVGQGFVGGSLTTVMTEKGVHVFAYDKAGKYAPGALPCVYDKGLANYPESIEELVEHCELLTDFSRIYFVCLPTPMKEDGSCDLSIVEGVIDTLSKIPCQSPDGRIVVIKSTVPPGSTEYWNKKYNNLHVVFNPEFLTEKNALDDMRNQNRIVLGGPRPWINIVKAMFQSAFPSVSIVKTSSTNAEMTKYITNCFLAMKVSFANEMYQICEGLGKQGLDIDYDRIIELATLDERLGTSHWKVPSFETDENGKPLFGYSGSCFPKDVNALMRVAASLGVHPKMLAATWEKNLEVRPGRDYLKLVGRAVSFTTDEKEKV